MPATTKLFSFREEKEIAVLNMVNDHTPNAVRFKGYVQWFNAVGLVMEYFPNGDLYELW